MIDDKFSKALSTLEHKGLYTAFQMGETFYTMFNRKFIYEHSSDCQSIEESFNPFTENDFELKEDNQFLSYCFFLNTIFCGRILFAGELFYIENCVSNNKYFNGTFIEDKDIINICFENGTKRSISYSDFVKEFF